MRVGAADVPVALQRLLDHAQRGARLVLDGAETRIRQRVVAEEGGDAVIEAGAQVGERQRGIREQRVLGLRLQHMVRGCGHVGAETAVHMRERRVCGGGVERVSWASGAWPRAVMMFRSCLVERIAIAGLEGWAPAIPAPAPANRQPYGTERAPPCRPSRARHGA